jgi:polyphenol oxidase
VHAGWRGTMEKIVLKTLRLMEKEFNSKTSDMIVSFGPSIKDCCYEVGADFFEKFPGDIKERGKRFYLDLSGANKRQLVDCGILEENIFDPGICTCCKSEDFFSFRREGASAGRQMSVMMLV